MLLPSISSKLVTEFSFFRYHIDTNQLNFPKKEMEVSNYMKDGMITDWDMFEQVFFYIHCDWFYHIMWLVCWVITLPNHSYDTLFNIQTCNGRCWITLTRRSSSRSRSCTQFYSLRLPGIRKTGGNRWEIFLGAPNHIDHDSWAWYGKSGSQQFLATLYACIFFLRHLA